MIWSTDELIDSLRMAPVLLRSLLVGVDEETAHHWPGADDWSVVEVVGHLIDAETRAIDRIDRIQATDDPLLEGYDQARLVIENGYQRRPLFDVVEQFELLRTRRLASLEALDETAWFRTATFMGRGTTPLTAITVHMCWHDTNHLAQIATNLKNYGTDRQTG